MNRIEIEPVDRVEITVLMDNLTDPLLVDQATVARMNWPKALLGGLPTVPALVSPGMPAHCTGWRAVHRLATRFADAFVMSTVGTTITL